MGRLASPLVSRPAAGSSGPGNPGCSSDGSEVMASSQPCSSVLDSRLPCPATEIRDPAMRLGDVKDFWLGRSVWRTSRMLQQITDLILGASTTVWGYLGLAVFVILDAVIPLFPSESLVISMASVLVHDHQVLLIVLFLVAAAAAWVGDKSAASTPK